ncbi:hypothetical protein J6590_028323 [Homalodisca vitripennis]|nr:hypothetical protein J6590_028323 [Homalodisca vitripennis]
MSEEPEAGSDAALMSVEEAAEAAVEQELVEPEPVVEAAPRDSTPSPSMKSGSVGSKGSSSLRPDMKASSSDLRQPSDQDDTDSELSDSENFLTKGCFLLTPSNELNMDKASAICEKMNFRGPYSLTKTATGILFKFAEMDDYHATFKKGFHKVTGARFYKKVIFVLHIRTMTYLAAECYVNTYTTTLVT